MLLSQSVTYHRGMRLPSFVASLGKAPLSCALSIMACGFQRSITAEVVGLSRLELPTSPLSGVRSNQLSYRPSFYPLLLSNQTICVSTCLRSEEHTSELQSRPHLVCRLLLEKKK